MEIDFIAILLPTLAIIFLLVGIVGCFLPILPGPPISWLGLLMMQFGEEPLFSSGFMWFWGIMALLVTALDYIIPPYGTKRFGGTKYGVWGSTLGLIVGLFFPPIGIILGPLVGAFVGEMLGGKTANDSLRPALGSFIGFLAGTGIKLITSLVMLVLFFYNWLW